jgi:dephospho-CoA kinase
MKKTYRTIGLTGGIGAGKSAAASRFRLLGAHVIDADVLAQKALEPGHICYRETIEAFGASILRADGSIDRRSLAGIVFSDASRRETLNCIVHPRVEADMMQEARAVCRQNPRAVIILDVPLLFECNMDKTVDASVLVVADDERRIERVVLRDGTAREDVAARIRAQMPQGEKRLRADYILANDGPLPGLYGQVDVLYQIFRSSII